MISKPLTAKERTDLLERMSIEEQRLQQEWGKTWDQLVKEYEQSVSDLLPNKN